MGERREKREQDDSEKKAPLSITAVPMEQSALKTVALFPVPCSSRLRLPSSFSRCYSLTSKGALDRCWLPLKAVTVTSSQYLPPESFSSPMLRCTRVSGPSDGSSKFSLIAAFLPPNIPNRPPPPSFATTTSVLNPAPWN